MNSSDKTQHQNQSHSSVKPEPKAGLAWAVLVASGLLEAVWATALGASDGFSRLSPTVLFLITLALSTIGLAYAMRSISTGTAYAVWTGIGATLTVIYAIVSGSEPASVLKIAFLILIIGCIVGLKLVHSEGKDKVDS